MAAIGGGLPRDDRAWPRWAGAFSVVVVLAALGTAGWAVVTAGRPLVVALAFAAVAAVSGWVFVRTFVVMLDEGRQSGWWVLAQLALVVGGFLAFGYDARVGAAWMSGLFGAMFAVNLWAKRRARRNRGLVEEVEAEFTRERERRTAEAADPVRVAQRRRPAVDVGGVLAAAARSARTRLVAWTVAAVAVCVALLLLGLGGLPVAMVAMVAGAAALWSVHASWMTWRARRDFGRGEPPPRRAWVVLLHDPAPRMIRPLLGIWSEEPIAGASFPKPEVVLRAGDDLLDLESFQGRVVVHEAWVDVSHRGFRGARWVAGDAGVALPHPRPLLFGRWYFHALTRAERPEPARQLLSDAPSPTATAGAPVVAEVGGPGLLSRIAWRVAGLAAFGAFFAWVDHAA